jgi:hypothetical protein
LFLLKSISQIIRQDKITFLDAVVDFQPILSVLISPKWTFNNDEKSIVVQTSPFTKIKGSSPSNGKALIIPPAVSSPSPS